MSTGHTMYNHSQISLASQVDFPEQTRKQTSHRYWSRLLLLRLQVCPHGTGKSYPNEGCLCEACFSRRWIHASMSQSRHQISPPHPVQPISEKTELLRWREDQGLRAHGKRWRGRGWGGYRFIHRLWCSLLLRKDTQFPTVSSPSPLPSTDYSNKLQGDFHACLWSSLFVWTHFEFHFVWVLFSGCSACLSVEGADSC